MLSQTAEYALRAVAFLASRANGESTIPEMAEATSINAPYLRKVLLRLRNAGLVVTQRGTGGGIRLNRDADELTMFDVLQAVDPIQRIDRCPLGLPEHVRLCPLHRELDDAIAEIYEIFKRKSIGELVATRRHPTRCPFPTLAVMHQP